MEKLILIDGNSLINRAFYATPLLTAKDGTPTNAVYGFVNMLFRLIKDENPTHVAVAFDVKAPTFRHLAYAEYKGTRKPMPTELATQLPILKETLSLMGITTLEKAGIEADDIIGTVAKNTDLPTIIITGDRDSFQLVDDSTEVHFTKRGISDIELLNNQNFKEKIGYLPHQVIDYKAIAGDSSDNIPGIKGVGEKTATALLTQYGSLENIYENLSDFKGKMLEKIVESKDIAFLSKQLATIKTDADIPFDINDMQLKLPFSSQLKEQFIRLDFKGLLKREEYFSAEDTKEQTAKVQSVVVTDYAILDSILDKNQIAITFDDEKSVYCDGVSYVIEKGISIFDFLGVQSAFADFLKKWSSAEKTLYVYNKKQLLHFLYQMDVSINCHIEDVSIMKYLADFTTKDESLKEVIIERGLEQNAPAYAVYTLYEEYSKTLKEEGTEKLYKEVELPLADVLFEMEINGFKADLVALEQLSEKYRNILDECSEKIYALAGERFNINSPKQLGDVLFEKMHIGKGKKTKNGYSTTAEVLESFADNNEVIPLILKYRKIQKLKSTYAEGLQTVANKQTGFIHTNFKQLVTATGRLSSAEPNLQNIPVRDEEGKEIRKCLIARDKEHVLVGADYSQIELRLLAAFSGCQKLIDAFVNGVDVHAVTASQVFGVSMQEVTPSMRRQAKAVNFGIIYGISEFGLAKDLKITNGQARAYINAYFEKYPEVKAYNKKCVEDAYKNGYVTTILGRRRVIKELSSSNYMQRQFGERAAMNMPLQGSSADIIKVAMVNVQNRLKKEGLKSLLILQVHDELVVDALVSEREKVMQILKEEMENAVVLNVPLTVEVESGINLLME